MLRKLRYVGLGIFTACFLACSGSNPGDFVSHTKKLAKSLLTDKQLTSDNLDQGQPATAYDNKNNRYLVVWTHTNVDGSSTDIKGRLYKGTGSGATGTGFSSYSGGVGTTINISSAAGNQTQPRVAFDPDNNRYLVVWTDNRHTYSQIYGQFVDVSGALVGSNFAVSVYRDSTSAYIVYDGTVSVSSGSSTVTGTATLFQGRDVQQGDLIEIQGKNYTIDSVASDTELTISTNFVGITSPKTSYTIYKSINKNQSEPDVVYNQVTKRFIVAWSDLSNNDSTETVCNTVVFGSYSTQFGAPIGVGIVGTGCVNATGPIRGGVPLPISDNNLVRTAEIDAEDSIINRTAYSQTATTSYSDDGNSIIKTWSLHKGESRPKITYSPITGDYFVAWSGKAATAELRVRYSKTGSVCSYNSSIFTGTDTDSTPKIMVRKNAGLGLIKDYSFGSKAFYPALATDPNTNRLLIAWEEQSAWGPNSDYFDKRIQGQMIDLSNFVNYGNQIDISSGHNGDRTSPVASYDNVNQRFLVAWEDARNSTANISNMDIYAQFIDPQGQLSGGNSLVTVAPGNQISPAVAFGGPLFRQFLVVWKDGRVPGNSDIYAQLLEYSVSPQLVVIGPDGNPILNGAYNFGTVTVGQAAQVNLKLRNDGNAPLNIFDHNDLPAPYSFVTQFPQQVTIAPGTTFDVTISFKPTANGSYAGTSFLMNINSDGGNSKLYLSGSGSGASALEITTASVAGGQPSVAYSQQLVASGGAYPYSSWAITANKPAWLSIDNTGRLTGTPPAGANTYTFEVTVTDSNFPNPNTAKKEFSIAIGAISITTTSLPDGSTDVLYSQQLTQNGAVAPFTWTLASGALPDGLLLGPLGSISGIPTKRGTFTFTVKLTDNNNAVASKDLTIKIDTPLAVNSSTLNYAILGDSGYQQTLTAKGGRAPYTWSIVSGALPSGLEIGPNSGVISGIAGAVGDFTFIAQVTDADGKTATQTFTIGVYTKILDTKLLDFGIIATNKPATRSITITNGTTTPFRINGIVQPAAPFSVSAVGALPTAAAPVTLLAGASFTFSVTANSATADSYNSKFTIKTDSALGDQDVVVMAKIVNPSMTISPASKLVTFTNVQTNQQATQIIEITNAGIIPLTVTGFSLPNQVTSPYRLRDLKTGLTVLTTDGFTLEQGEKRQLQVIFAPTTSGNYPTIIEIFFDHLGPDNPVKFTITGETVPSSMQLINSTTGEINPTSIDFGKVKAGTSSGDIQITIKNDGQQDYIVTTNQLNPPFTITYWWLLNSLIKAQQSDSFLINFKPTARGQFTQTVSVTSDTGVTKSFNITGTGVAPILRTLSDNVVDFGTVLVGTSLTKSIVLYNDGDGQLDIKSLGTLPKGYSFVNTPVSIDPGSSTVLQIKFTPNDAGPFPGSFTIKTDGGDQEVNIVGNGTGPKLTTSLNQLDFGSITQNSTYTQKLTLTNGGSAPLNITGLTNPSSALFKLIYTGPAPTVEAPITLLPGTSFDLYVQFLPTNVGTFISSFTIASDAINVTGGVQTINLQGFGVPLSVATNPSTLIFSRTALDTSQTMNLEVKNTGTSPVKLTSIDAPAAPFTFDSLPTLPLSIDPGNSTTIKVKFSPTSAGGFSSSIGLLFNSATSPVIVNVSGTGGLQTATSNLVFLQNGSEITSAPFGTVYKGAIKTAVFGLKNKGPTPLTIDSKVFPSGYMTNLVTPMTLTAGEEKSFTVTFAPTAAKTYSGTLTVSDSAAQLTAQLSLSGTGSAVFVLVKNATNSILSDVNFASLSDSELSQLVSTKPQNVPYINSGVQFRVDSLNKSIPETVKVQVTFDALPNNPVFYKVTNGVWKELPNASLTGNTLEYSITDNSDLDSDITLGAIVDPIVVTSSTSGGTTNQTTGVPQPSSGGGGGGGGCFIATAAYGSYLDPHVMVLRNFRDEVLLKSEPGRAFVKLYYNYSPPVADFIREYAALRLLTRLLLTPIILVCKFPAIIPVMLFASFTVLWGKVRRRCQLREECPQQ